MKNRPTFVRILVSAIVTMGILGGTAGVAEARPNDCSGIRKAVVSSYNNYQHYWSGGHVETANFWYGVYEQALDNYFNCVYAQ